MYNNVNDVIDDVLSYEKSNNIAYIKVLESNKPAFEKIVSTDGTFDEIVEDLRQWLEKQKRNSNNTNKYCIQLFKQLKENRKGGLIPDGTPVHIYLQFSAPLYSNQIGYVENGTNEILKQLAEQNKLIIELLTKEEPEEEEDPKQNGLIGAIMQDEQLKAVAIGFLSKLFSGNKIAAVAGVEPQSEIEKINLAISILKNHDENIAEHLMTLATIAENEPGKFAMLISMIDKI